MFERRLRIGTYFGIGLYVHWTFVLLVAYIGYASRDEGWMGVAYGITQLAGVFLCVTLHEYGHALAARQFGVPTLDITLLPIGGVARLQRMPRVPWQELVVAVAGPAVNVVIAIGLIAVLFVMHGFGLWASITPPWGEREAATFETLLTMQSVTGLLFSMLLVNVMLVVFNMIPAFPMDGGRVFRSVLAMMTTYRKATFIASRVGLFCAAAMAMIGLSSGALAPILIAAFIAYAGMAEAREVEVMESVRGLSIQESMIRRPPAIEMNMTLENIAMAWQGIPLSSLPVISMTGSVVGMLRLEDVAKAIRDGESLTATAGMIADHGVPTIGIHEELEAILLRSGGASRQLAVVDEQGALVGLLDLDSMLARGVLGSVANRFPISPNFPESHFDALN